MIKIGNVAYSVSDLTNSVLFDQHSMTAFPESGRSLIIEIVEISVRFRPTPDVQIPTSNIPVQRWRSCVALAGCYMASGKFFDILSVLLSSDAAADFRR